jgi:hypothetical protein
MGLYAAIYKFVLCLMRRLTNSDDGKNAFLGGFLAAMALAIDTGSRR